GGGEHAFAYFRTIVGLPEGAHKYQDFDEVGQPDTEAFQYLVKLKKEIEESLPEAHVHKYLAAWERGGLSSVHLDTFCARVEADLTRVILAELGKGEQQTDLEWEI